MKSKRFVHNDLVASDPGTDSHDRERWVPTLFRLLASIAVLVALVYGAMLAMVTFLQPQPREITQTIALPAAGK